MLRWPVEPMRATTRIDLPTAADTTGLVYQPKWDGWRALAWATRDGVRLQSRSLRDLTPYFPDLARILAEHLPTGVALDGELISWDTETGRTSFTALQRRITAGRGLDREAAERPAHFVAFDVLQDGRGRELVEQPLQARRRRLARLLAGAAPQLVLCPQTSDPETARTWFAEHTAAGIEGLVIKPADSPYRLGEAGWWKVKTKTTAEYVIGGITGPLDQPRSLLLGRYDQRGRLRFLSQTHQLRPGQRRELAGLLPMAFRGAGSGHPWPCPLPGAWSVELTDRQPVPYTQVEPTLVAEVEVDTAQDGPLRKPRHRSKLLRTRPDLHPDEITTV